MAGSGLWKLWAALLLVSCLPSSVAQTTTADAMAHIVCPTGKTTGVLPEVRSACAALSSEIAAATRGAVTVVTEITFPPTTFYASTESNGQVTFVPHTASARSSRVTLEMTMSSKGATSATGTSSRATSTSSLDLHSSPPSIGSGAAATRSSASATSSSNAQANSNSGRGGLSGGDIAGIVLGVVIGGLVICIFILLCVAFRQRRAKRRAAENDMLFDTEAKAAPFGDHPPELPPAPSETVLGGTWLSNRSSDLPDEFNDQVPLVDRTAHSAATETQVLPQESSKPAVPATMFGTSTNVASAVSGAHADTLEVQSVTDSHGMTAAPIVAAAAGGAGAAALAAAAIHHSHHDQEDHERTAYSNTTAAQPVGPVQRTPEDSLASNRGSGGSADNGMGRFLQVNDTSPAPSETNSSNLGVGLVSTGTGVFVPSHQKTCSASGIMASGDSSPSSSAIGVPTTMNSSPLTQHAEIADQQRNYSTSLMTGQAQSASAVQAQIRSQPQIEVQTPTPKASTTSMALPATAAVAAGSAAAVAAGAAAQDQDTSRYEQRDIPAVEPSTPRPETATPTAPHGYGHQGYMSHDQESQGYSASETEGEFVTPMTSRLNLDGSSQYATGSSNLSEADDDADDQDPGETPRQTMIGLPIGQQGQGRFSPYAATPTRGQQYEPRPRSDSLGSDRTPTPPRTPRGGPIQHEDDVLDLDDEEAAKRRREAHRISADLGHMPGSWYDADQSDLPENIDASSTLATPAEPKLQGFDFGFVRPDISAENADSRFNP